MLKPSAETYKAFCFDEEHKPFFIKILCDLGSQARGMQENTAAHFGMVLVKAIAANINRSRVGFHDLLAVGVYL